MKVSLASRYKSSAPHYADKQTELAYITHLQFFAEPVLELLECTDIGVSPVADAFVLNKAARGATDLRMCFEDIRPIIPNFNYEPP